MSRRDRLASQRRETANGGDTADERLAHLIREHHGHVLAYVRRRLSDWHTAEELTAETFVVAWRRLGRVPDPPLPWLYRVARGLLLNEYRKVERRACAEQRAPRASLHAVDPGALVGETDRVVAALARLSEQDRELLMLIGWEELSVREAALALSVPAAVVSVRLFRARRRLTAALEQVDREAASAESLNSTQYQLRSA